MKNTENMNIESRIKELDNKKSQLSKEVDELISVKKRLYSNMDIESPMSAEEKELTKKIANIFSKINAIILEKRNMKREQKWVL